MGCNIRQTAGEFRIKAANQPAAFRAAMAMPNRGYDASWKDRNGVRDIYSVLEYWGYAPTLDKPSGDIIALQLEAEKLDEEVELFKAIAPYVDAGSYIEILAPSYNEMWRWVFDGKTCREIRPKIVWPE
jgi:hypothetical protein